MNIKLSSKNNKEYKTTPKEKNKNNQEWTYEKMWEKNQENE